MKSLRSFHVADLLVIVFVAALGIALLRESVLSLNRFGFPTPEPDPSDRVRMIGSLYLRFAFLVMVLFVPLLAVATVTSVIVPPLLRREAWPRIQGRPGSLGCVAATVGMLAAGLASGVSVLEILGNKAIFQEFWKVVLWSTCAKFAGVAVIVSWTQLVLTRRWRRDAEPIGWVGRVVSVGWIVVFGVAQAKLWVEYAQ